MGKHFKTMPGRFALRTVTMFSAVVMMLPSVSLAADRPLQKINVAYSSISGNQAALWVSQDKGFFRKYGLEVQAVLIESGTTTAQALVASDISFANVAGSATDFAMRYALDKYGVDANKEVTILQMGNQPAQLAALEAGKIQGAMLSAPTSIRAKKMGFPMLADLQMLGLKYQHTSIATTRALLKSKPDLPRYFTRPYIQRIQHV